MKNKTGTKVTFYPDDSIFETVEFKPETIRKKLKEIAYLNKNLKIVFKDEHTGEEQTYLEEFGIQSYIKYINRDTAVLHDDVIYIEGKSGDIEVEVAFQYTQNYSEQINAYCNRINVADGGTLVTGFKTALTRIMNQYARELNFLKNKESTSTLPFISIIGLTKYIYNFQFVLVVLLSTTVITVLSFLYNVKGLSSPGIVLNGIFSVTSSSVNSPSNGVVISLLV